MTLAAFDFHWPGQGILPETFGASRQQLLRRLGVAYELRMREEGANYVVRLAAQEQICSTIRRTYRALGLEAATLVEEALWARIMPLAASREPEAHLRLCLALLTDYTSQLRSHITYRLRNGGNVHLQATGTTGMGKSSCLVALMDAIKRIQRGQLTKHLAFDPGQLPDKFTGKQPGDTVLLDENLAVAGEGSRTLQQTIANLEDTLRASQINLFTASPTIDETGTTQFQLEALLWSPPLANTQPGQSAYRCRKCSRPYMAGVCACGWQPWTLFLVWVHGVPMGVVAITWMAVDLYQEYAPWKAANVERTKQAQFNDTRLLARLVARTCEDARFVKFLGRCKEKPRLRDFNTALTLFAPQMMAQVTLDKLAHFMEDLFYGWDQLGADFQEWFDVKPNEGMMQIAQRCYK